jgi:hypothetical protein
LSFNFAAAGAARNAMPNIPSTTADCSSLGPTFGPLVASAPLNELGAGKPDNAARQKLENLSLADAFAPHVIADREMANACLAGLWLLYDDLDRSHTISQSIHTPTGSYWHAIMHRREGDFGNSKYWFDRVGDHPIFGPLAHAAAALVQEEREEVGDRPADRDLAWLAEEAYWDPFRFVDLCAAVVRGRSNTDQLCRLIQKQECRLLLEFCYRRATGLS